MADLYTRAIAGDLKPGEVTADDCKRIRERKANSKELRQYGTCRAAETGTRTDGRLIVNHLASSETVARDADVILATAWSDDIGPTPFLWMHNWDLPGLGRLVEATKAERDGIRGLYTSKSLINTEGGSSHEEFVRVIGQMILDGDLPHVSVSWNPLEVREAREADLQIWPGLMPWSLIHERVEFLEESCVTVPADPLATVRALERFDQQGTFNAKLLKDFRSLYPLNHEQADEWTAEKVRAFVDLGAIQRQARMKPTVKDELPARSEEPKDASEPAAADEPVQVPADTPQAGENTEALTALVEGIRALQETTKALLEAQAGAPSRANERTEDTADEVVPEAVESQRRMSDPGLAFYEALTHGLND